MSLHFHLPFEYLLFQVWKRKNLPSLPSTGKACRTPYIWWWLDQLTLPIVLDKFFSISRHNKSISLTREDIDYWTKRGKNKDKREKEEERGKTKHPGNPEDIVKFKVGLVLCWCFIISLWWVRSPNRRWI